MGKEGGGGGFMTPKAIANRIKAKGLLKLKFYCQICNKQCRDDNGFKCHINSESHQRQLLIVAESPDKYVDQFSKEFLDNFIKLLSRSYGTKRILANQVYQQYIQDREHLHMNSTQWETLSDFVKYLGREGICEVDETPRGWYIAWIDRSPETLAREEALRKKELADLADQQLQQLLIEEQIERAVSSSKAPEPEYTELKRENPEEKIKFSITKVERFKKPEIRVGLPAQSAPAAETAKKDGSPEAGATDGQDAAATGSSAPQEPGAGALKRKLAALDDEAGQASKPRADPVPAHAEKQSRKDYWLAKGILVRVISQKLAGGKYFRKKGVVQRVVDFYVGEVRIVDPADTSVDGDVIKLDQEFLETVVPAVGGAVRIVNGAYRGELATVTARDGDEYLVALRISQGPHADRAVDKVPFEDVCSIG